MSRYPGRILSSTAPTVNANTAKGIWTLDEALRYSRAGQWPVPTGNGDPYFQYNTMLLPGQGTNGAQNNTFLDSSSNNFTITRNGNTTQGTFTPFSQAAGYWGNYFDGTGDYFTSSTSLFNYTTGNASNETFTIEAYIYHNARSTPSAIQYSQSIAAKGDVYLNFGINGTGNLIFYHYDGSVRSFTGSSVIPLNQWTHVAVRVTGGTATLYVNGVSDGSGTWYGIQAAGLTATSYFGTPALNASALAFNGFTSNLRISNNARTITVPTAPYSNDANTVFLTSQSNRFIDNSSNAYAITPVGGVSVTPFQPFGAPTTAYSASTIGGSGYFDGTGDYLVTPSSSNLAVGTGDFCVEMWLYTPASAASQNLYTNANSSVGGDTGLGIFLTSTTAVRLASWNTAFLTTGTGVIVGNQWNHIAVCRSGTTASIFVNGTRQATGTVSNNFSSTSAFTIGSAVSPGDYLTGYISSLRTVKGSSVYDPTQTTLTLPTAPLTAVTNTQLLLSGTNAGIIDNAQDNNLETVGNAQISTTQYKWGASSMYFDGTGDYLYSPSTATTRFGSANWTIETWVRPSSIGSRQIILAWNAVSSGYAACAINLCANGKIGLQISESGSGWKYDDTTTGLGYALSANTWYYLAIIRIGQIITVFLDGNAIGTYSLTASTTSLMTNDTRNVVGISPDLSNQPFTGYLQDTRVTNGYARYQYNFTAPTAAFPLFWQAAATPSSDPYFDYTTLLLPGNGTNGAQNNTFLDSSTNNFSITRNGNTTQGTFTPFSQTGWGNYFDGTGDYLSVANNVAFQFGTGDLTCEAWVYPTATPATNYTQIAGMQEYGASLSWLLGIDTNLNLRGSLQTTSPVSSTELTGGQIPLHQWSHVAMSRSGTVFSIYINGVRVATTITSQNVDSSGNNLTIGADNNGDEAVFTGYISNVRVVKGTAVYTGTSFTVPTSALTAVTNTQLLTCQSNRFIDNSTNAFTITRNGDTSVQAFSPFNPTAAYSTSTVGGSGYFDASGDYLSISDASNLASPGSGDFTAECWLYVPSLPSNALGASAVYHLKNDTGTSTTVFIIEITSGGALNLSTGTALIAGGTSGRVIAGAWNHLVVSRLSGTLRSFINGTVDISVSNSTTYNGSVVQIGAWRYSTSDFSINGYIGGFRFQKGSGYSSITVPTAPFTAITNTSLLLLGTNGGIIDNTAKNNLETVGGASISTTVSKFGGSSMYFDGSGDYLSVPHSALQNMAGGDITIECWVYVSAKNNCTFFAKGSGASNWEYFLGYDGTTLSLFYNGNTSATMTDTISLNTWTHVAMSRYGSSLMVFVNGIRLVNATYSGTTTYTNPLGVGAAIPLAGSGYVMNGYIQDFRLTKGIARYTTNFTPPTTAFLTL